MSNAYKQIKKWSMCSKTALIKTYDLINSVQVYLLAYFC